MCLLGWTLDWSLEPATDTTADEGAALNGGTTTSYPVDAGPTDQHMGFTLGLEDRGQR